MKGTNVNSIDSRKCWLFRNSRIKVEVIPTGSANDSAPQHVFKRLNEFSQKYDFGPEDTLWLVLDVDRWGDKVLSEVCREAKQKGYGLAISNPCFETWLCLHFDDLEPDDRTCRDFTNRLRLISGGYNKSNLDIDSFKDRIPDAIQRAERMHPDETQLWPPTIESHVYRVVERILKTMKSN